MTGERGKGRRKQAPGATGTSRPDDGAASASRHPLLRSVHGNGPQPRVWCDCSRGDHRLPAGQVHRVFPEVSCTCLGLTVAARRVERTSTVIGRGTHVVTQRCHGGSGNLQNNHVFFLFVCLSFFFSPFHIMRYLRWRDTCMRRPVADCGHSWHEVEGGKKK